VRAALAGLAIVLLGAPALAEPPVREDYTLHCSGCHGADAAGTAGVAPTLHGLASLLESDGGRDYLARVPGVAQAPLSDARLARLLNWVLSEFSGTAPVPAYSADEVGRLREQPLRDAPAARPRAG
jgi:mono/diheme cytochrome c family protein